MTAPKPDRRADRHTTRTIGRLDNPDLDAWVRAHAKATGQPVSRVVSTAVRQYRHEVETPICGFRWGHNPENPTDHIHKCSSPPDDHPEKCACACGAQI